uniref:Uncharacterized protein n=1 Tax=Beauveria bassiana chrysovirus 2 TaxID=2810134 RepID=A0A7U1GII9_9VIRU|nr:hypothetical protein [Beauveria bassiana chrysovirus 2]
MALSQFATEAALGMRPTALVPTSSPSGMDLAIAAARERKVVPLERTMIVATRRLGGVPAPVGQIAPPSEEQGFVRAYTEVQSSVGRPPVNTVDQYASALHRVWASGAQKRRSTTTMRRAVVGGANASASTHLGLPLTLTAGPLHHPGNAHGDITLSAAREWLDGVVRGSMGAFSAHDWRVDVAAEVDVMTLTGGRGSVNSYTLTPSAPGVKPTASVSVIAHCQEAVTVYDMHVNGWQTGGARAKSVIVALLDAASQLLVTGRWTPCNSVYVPTAPNVGSMRQYKNWPSEACHANVFNKALGPPPQEQLTSKTLVIQYDVMSGVSSGVVAACDVSPSLLIIGGSPSGHGVRYSVCRVVVDGVRAHYTSVACQQKEQPLLFYNNARRQPCRRDGLLSPQLVNLLTGYGDGVVGMDFIDRDTERPEAITVRSLWCDALESPDSRARLLTRDPEQAVSSMMAIALLQGWTLGAGAEQFELQATTQAGRHVYLSVEYWPTVGPRWAEYLSVAEPVDLSPDRDDGFFEYPSELALDYWMSGLARYIMKERIVAGRACTGPLMPVEHAHGLFPLLQLDPADQAPSLDVVLHVGKVQAVRRGEAVGVYVYALGAALCQAGHLITTCEILDDEVELVDASGSAPATERYNRLREQVRGRGCVQAVLRQLAKLAQLDKVRVYGSGVGAAIERCKVEVADGADMEVRSKLREVGPLVSPAVMLPGGWGYATSPGSIAAAHAYSSGLVAVLPPLGSQEVITQEELWSTVAELAPRRATAVG